MGAHRNRTRHKPGVPAAYAEMSRQAQLDAARASLAYFEGELAKMPLWERTGWTYWHNRVVDTRARIERLEAGGAQ